MKVTPFLLLMGLASSAAFAQTPPAAPQVTTPISLALFPTREFNVRDYGAKGDGVAVDSPAINQAIDAAAAAGGGVVRLPAGTYLSYTIHLRSNITLRLDKDTILLAGAPGAGGAYDPPEPNAFSQYQDGGHGHWMNSLIVGIGLDHVAITGPGVIKGTGLNRGDGGPGNKAIALKNCRFVVLQDFWVLDGGHFALLASGVDDFLFDGVKTDTNRDSFDIDCCRRGFITHCQLNSHNDDALVLKTSFGLGEARPCEDLVLTHCTVTGYDQGTFYDGTKLRANPRAPDGDGPTGRIKFGTESDSAFRRISISDCIFDHSRGLAFETVDGGIIEDVSATNLTMTDINTAPIFFRIGNRARGPDHPPIGIIRRVLVSNVTATGVDPRFPILIAGLPDHPVQDVTLSNLHITSKGGFSLAMVASPPPGVGLGFSQRGNRGGRGAGRGVAPALTGALGGAPPDFAAGTAAPAPAPGTPGTTATPRGPRDPYAVPENPTAYPEPSMFGLLPGYGVYARHAANLTVQDVTFGFEKEDTRPVVVLDDVQGSTFQQLQAQRGTDAPYFVLRQVTAFTATGVPGLADTRLDNAPDTKL